MTAYNLTEIAQHLQNQPSLIDPHTQQPYQIKVSQADAAMGRQLQVTVQLDYPAATQHVKIRTAVEQALASQTENGLASPVYAAVTFKTTVHNHSVQMGVDALPQVKNTLAVASGKGGVGKSTTAANLALALAAEGARVGLLDADIYGPSQTLLMGVAGKPAVAHKLMVPLLAHPKVGHGVQVMSMGMLVGPDQAMIWRGPMATQALEQLLRQTAWGSTDAEGKPLEPLDYLVIDMPPGTGDIHLTLAQKVPLTGAVVVTTPQDLALLDAVKGVKMFEKVQVPMLGLIENMALHTCSQCGYEEHIFGHGGGQKMAAASGLEYLGALPLTMRIREQSDSGMPTVAAAPESAEALTYHAIARRIAAKLSLQNKSTTRKFPTIKISAAT